jgi:hypothetical protein
VLALRSVAQRINDLYQRPRSFSFSVFFFSFSLDLLHVDREPGRYHCRYHFAGNDWPHYFNDCTACDYCLMQMNGACQFPSGFDRATSRSMSEINCPRSSDTSQQDRHRRVRHSAMRTRDLPRFTSWRIFLATWSAISLIGLRPVRDPSRGLMLP